MFFFFTELEIVMASSVSPPSSFDSWHTIQQTLQPRVREEALRSLLCEIPSVEDAWRYRSRHANHIVDIAINIIVDQGWQHCRVLKKDNGSYILKQD